MYNKYSQSMSSRQYCKILQMDQNESMNFDSVKNAYRKKMISVTLSRYQRVQINMAYDAALSTIYKTQSPQLLIAISRGQLTKVNYILDSDKSLMNKIFFRYPILYYAVRSGHYDIVQLILKKGCCLKFQGQKSTPMHCAAYYGHRTIIPLLLFYGIPTNIKNFASHLPIQQAATQQIKNLLEKNNSNKINLLNERLLKDSIGYTLLNIQKNKKIVIKKFILNRYFKDYSQYQDAFHGTSFQNFQSIAKNGLRKPGQIVNGKKIKIVPGHIPEDATFQGHKNWSKAIFVSPSIYYAAHPVYARQVISQSQTWLPIVQVKVKKGSFTRHDHNLQYYQIGNNEPTNLQWRVQIKTNQKNLIMRTQESSRVQVIALILLKKGFLDDNPNYQQTTNLIVHSIEQIKMSKHFKKQN